MGSLNARDYEIKVHTREYVIKIHIFRSRRVTDTVQDSFNAQ